METLAAIVLTIAGAAILWMMTGARPDSPETTGEDRT